MDSEDEEEKMLREALAMSLSDSKPPSETTQTKEPTTAKPVGKVRWEAAWREATAYLPMKSLQHVTTLLAFN